MAQPSVQMPPLPLSGGCQCRQSRYLITERPLVFYLCHCSECQRQTASAFGESLRIPRDALKVTGELKLTVRSSESGTRREGWFCPQCGVRIWHGSSGSTEINIKAGTLDDTSWLIPAGHIWVQSAQPFMRFSDDDIVEQTQSSKSYELLKARWNAMTS